MLITYLDPENPDGSLEDQRHHFYGFRWGSLSDMSCELSQKWFLIEEESRKKKKGKKIEAE